jgi:type IV pilus assembly protein PilB
MRVLGRSVVALSLENIGLREDEQPLFEEILSLPHGIVLVTGPTGSGKTTTLYAALNEVNREDVKVITVEDPVEYDLEGIVQVPIHNDIGVTYASVLRTILRQDPDKILVGEIRDEETARTAIEASLTGHTVFSTLHTNDAPSAVTRMLDMGVEPYLLTSTVEFIIAQRLVRRVCKHCKTFYEPDDKVLYELALKPSDIPGKKFAFGKGCEECNLTGYPGPQSPSRSCASPTAARSSSSKVPPPPPSAKKREKTACATSAKPASSPSTTPTPASKKSSGRRCSHRFGNLVVSPSKTKQRRCARILA